MTNDVKRFIIDGRMFDGIEEMEVVEASAYDHLIRENQALKAAMTGTKEDVRYDNICLRSERDQARANNNHLQDEIEQLTASRSALERECERLQGVLAKIRDCTCDMWVCAFAAAILTGKTTEDAFKAAKPWEDNDETYARAEVDRLRAQLPRVAEAITDLETKLAGRKALLDCQWIYPILERMKESVTAPCAGADEVREVEG